jgi:hypothetical protein
MAPGAQSRDDTPRWREDWLTDGKGLKTDCLMICRSVSAAISVWISSELRSMPMIRNSVNSRYEPCSLLSVAGVFVERFREDYFFVVDAPQLAGDLHNEEQGRPIA